MTRTQALQALGLSTAAAEKEDIRRAWKNMARQYHPDVNSSPGATERFQEIQNAHDFLIKGRNSNPHRRSRPRPQTQVAQAEIKFTLKGSLFILIQMIETIRELCLHEGLGLDIYRTSSATVGVLSIEVKIRGDEDRVIYADQYIKQLAKMQRKAEQAAKARNQPKPKPRQAAAGPNRTQPKVVEIITKLTWLRFMAAVIISMLPITIAALLAGMVGLTVGLGGFVILLVLLACSKTVRFSDGTVAWYPRTTSTDPAIIC
jgi:hypothetical protein